MTKLKLFLATLLLPAICFGAVGGGPIKDYQGNYGTIRPSGSGSTTSDTAIVVTDRPDNTGTPTQTSISCGTSSTTVLAANAAASFVIIRNPTTATITVWINVAGAAATAAAPSIDLAPGSEADFSAGNDSFLPTSAINCIATTASTLTVVYK